MPNQAQRLAALRAEVMALRHDVAAGGNAIYRSWRGRIERPAFAASALNFAHYLALRRIDLRLLQRRLMVLGLSSLGRSESHVMAALDATAWALAGLTGEASRLPSERQFLRGEKRLSANTAALFGPPYPGRAVRIMVTLGVEAAEDPAYLVGLAERGVEVVRINCAHDDPDVWRCMVENARAAGGVRPLRILMDIAGPKVRTEAVFVPSGRTHLEIGDELVLCRAIEPERPGAAFQATCAPSAVLDRLQVGATVSLDDGKLRGLIVSCTGADFTVRVTSGRTKGLKLKPGRGLNFPAVELGLDPLTDKDRGDLDFIAAHADLVGLSFVQNADQVASLQRELAQRRADWRQLGIVAKIETPAAVSNLPEIIVQAAGIQPLAVMIARGDLAVEIGFERLAEIQEEILWLCEAAHVPAIWATQVLEGLVQEGTPSRGEMTDAAMSSRAECVMLNKGPNVTMAVDVLTRLLGRMSGHQVKKTPTLRALRSWPEKAEAAEKWQGASGIASER